MGRLEGAVRSRNSEETVRGSPPASVGGCLPPDGRELLTLLRTRKEMVGSELFISWSSLLVTPPPAPQGLTSLCLPQPPFSQPPPSPTSPPPLISSLPPFLGLCFLKPSHHRRAPGFSTKGLLVGPFASFSHFAPCVSSCAANGAGKSPDEELSVIRVGGCSVLKNCISQGGGAPPRGLPLNLRRHHPRGLSVLPKWLTFPSLGVTAFLGAQIKDNRPTI